MANLENPSRNLPLNERTGSLQERQVLEREGLGIWTGQSPCSSRLASFQGLHGWEQYPLFTDAISFCYRVARREHADPAIEELNPGDASEPEGRGTGEPSWCPV